MSLLRNLVMAINLPKKRSGQSFSSSQTASHTKKSFFLRAWNFLWKDDSWTSWAIHVLLSFLIIKFLVYPGLGFFLQTKYPIVAVVSGSMEHDGTFEDWWGSEALCKVGSCTQEAHYSSLGISKEEFQSFSYTNGFDVGDIMILYGTPADKLAVGDVIVFVGPRPDPIIHRIVFIDQKNGQRFFSTKGDHNAASFGFEEHISENAYLGRAAVRIPYLGYIKIEFVRLVDLIKSTVAP